MVRIRLRRVGAKKNPFYRIVVADQRTSRNGSFIEQIGTYNPFPNPSLINIDTEKLNEWINKGAQPSESVISLMFSVGITNKFTSKIVKRPPQPKIKKEAPKDEAPKDEAPKDEAPKDEAPKDEAPKDEAPKDEAPKDEAPK
ncbi:MAG: 30S ribosomal protein S16, partial [Chloroflexi bacterium]|nr:30S ribosomal protein S16 [Chloroflexota bacterium]